MEVAYIPYLRAFKLLSARLSDTTPEELAAWVWWGPEHGGLAAYLNANELEDPPRFHYGYSEEKDPDYIAPLMACWFSDEDIANFQPGDRYITGKALIERWSKEPAIQPDAFIRAKIEESQLSDLHPFFGGTHGTFSDRDFAPPLESGLFPLSEINNQKHI